MYFHIWYLQNIKIYPKMKKLSIAHGQGCNQMLYVSLVTCILNLVNTNNIFLNCYFSKVLECSHVRKAVTLRAPLRHWVTGFFDGTHCYFCDTTTSLDKLTCDNAAVRGLAWPSSSFGFSKIFRHHIQQSFDGFFIRKRGCWFWGWRFTYLVVHT